MKRRNITVLVLVMTLLGQLLSAQVFYDFSQNGALPSGWTEYNSSSRVTVTDGKLQFDYDSSKPSAYLSFAKVSGDDVQLTFDVESTRNWFKASMDLYSSNETLIASLIFGNNGTKRILLATGVDASGNPNNYVNLTQSNFSSKTPYQVKLLINTETNTFDASVDANAPLTSQAFLNSTSDVAKIDFKQLGMYGGSGQFLVDNVIVSQGGADFTGLSQAIAEAEDLLAKAAIGTGLGEHTQASADAFQEVINQAKATFALQNSTQEQIDSAIEDLQDSQLSFNSQRNWGDKSGTVNVNMNSLLTVRNPEWFGGNNTYNGSGQGLWDGSTDRCYPYVIDLANYTGATTYRFPGGTMANLYQWKRAIGPLDERIDNLNSHGRGQALSNDFGPDEFGKMLKRSPLSNGVIVVAYSHDKPQDAADYVEYMNFEVGENPNGGIDWAAVRAQNGHPEPYGVKYWEIGNELYGGWELSVRNYPTSGDENRGGDRIRSGSAYFYVNGGSQAFTNQRAAIQTSWDSVDCLVNGQPNQEFYTKFYPVNLSSSFTLTINGTTWTRVTSLTTSGATDMHYVVDAESGKITFGDGVNGKIPSGGYDIKLYYTTGPHPGFPDYYEAMKAVDPDISVISCYEKEAFYKEMANINKPYDGVAKHYYPSSSPEAGDEYKASMRNATRYKIKVDEHLEHLATYNNTSLTEINVKQHLTEFGAGGRVIGAVTYPIIMWHYVINDYSEDVGTMLVHSFFKNDNTPIVNTAGHYISSKGYAYHIFTRLHQDNFVKADYQGDAYTYNSSAIDYTYPTASVSNDGNTLTVVVPNTLDQDNLNITINISNYGFSGEEVVGKKWLATAYDIYAVNSEATPNAVSLEGPFDFELSQSVTDKVPPFSTAVYQWKKAERASYLSDLDVDVLSGNLSEDESFDSQQALVVNGITYTKGIALSSSSTAAYSLQGNYTRFVAELGLEDSEIDDVAASFKVLVDGQEVYVGESMLPNSPTATIDIDVTDANELKIITESNGSNEDVVSVFGGAKLYLSDYYSSISEDKFGAGNTIMVYPNPAKDMVNVDFNQYGEGAHYSLFNMNGKIILNGQLELTNTIDVSSLPQGVYLLSVSGFNSIYQKRLIVE